MSKLKFLLSLFLVFSFSMNVLAKPQKIEEAEFLMNKFQKSSYEYNNDLAEMYSDDAKILRNLIHNNGKTEKVTLPVKKYKKTLKSLRFLAKIKGYKNNYTNLVYKIEDQNVRITGIRETGDGYKAPVSLLVGKDKTQEWKILEETTNTKAIFLVKRVLRN